jgi:hypothetical protein
VGALIEGNKVDRLFIYVDFLPRLKNKNKVNCFEKRKPYYKTPELNRKL